MRRWGAGLAGVSNVPLAGSLFTAEILIGVVTLSVALPALCCSAVATLTAWLCLPAQLTYLGVPDYPVTASALVWALVASPLIGLVAVGLIRTVAFVSHHRARGWVVLVAPLAAFGVSAALGQLYPPSRCDSCRAAQLAQGEGVQQQPRGLPAGFFGDVQCARHVQLPQQRGSDRLRRAGRLGLSSRR